MQKKVLKVQPAKRIYQPKYPSFEDKNPLLYPETRPYPFNRKFINWVSTGGLASIMLFGGNDVMGQSATDSLYYPFPLENAHVPYRPVSFGTGMPQRLKTEEAIQAIRKAFSESGIELEEHVWFKDKKIGIYLDGYSPKDKIGFLFLDYKKMDSSFTIDNRYNKKGKKSKKKKYNLDYDIKRYFKYRDEEYKRFKKEKEKYIKQQKRYNETEASLDYTGKLSLLDPNKKESKKLFDDYYLQYRIASIRINSANLENDLQKKFFHYVDDRFEYSVEKQALFASIYNSKLNQNRTEEFSAKLEKEIKKLKKIKSDKKFIKKYLILNDFLNYDNGSYLLKSDKTYQALKLKIMKAYPLKRWMNNLGDLNKYHDRIFVSLDEAKHLDKNNKRGTQFIAPISARDRMMILGGSGIYFSSEELSTEEGLLRKEFNRRNGMTDEILKQRRLEMNEQYEKYSWDKLKNLPQQEKDSLLKIRNQGTEDIKAKYKAMEQLTDKEREEFKVKFADLHKRKNEWQKKQREEIKMKTLRKLEQEVKVYIKWAQSQMGG